MNNKINSNILKVEYAPISYRNIEEKKDNINNTIDNTLDNDNMEYNNASNTLFIKNISFTTNKDSLYTLFNQYDNNIRNITIVNGYGFIECSNNNNARVILDKCNGIGVDGHKIEISYSKTKE